MKDLKTIQVEKERIDKMSGCVSAIINEIKDDYFLEGVFYIGTGRRPGINLGIVYNDYKFHFDCPREKRLEIDQESGMELRIEEIAIWRYEDDKRKNDRLGHPIEFMLRYGEILYDKDGNLAILKQQLEKDDTLEAHLDYWMDARKIEPPLQFIKK